MTRIRAYVPAGLLTLFLLPVSSSASPLPEQQTFRSPWTLGVGISATTPYSYHTNRSFLGSQSREDEFGHALLATLALNREVGKKSSIQASLDHFYAQEGIKARIMSFSTGVRRFLGADRHEYVECLPAVYLGRWADVGEYSITSLRPGFQIGIGTQGALRDDVGIDLGIRFRYSTGWPNVQKRFYDSEDYHGVRQVAVGLKVLGGL